MEGSGSFSGGLKVDATSEHATIVLTETNSVDHLFIVEKRIIDRAW